MGLRWSSHSLVSCLVESLKRRSGVCNVALALVLLPMPALALAPLDAPLALPLVLALVPALAVELPAALRWDRVALISQCNCIRMLLMAAFVCSVSSFCLWLSLMIIMLVRPSSSVSALVIRDTSSRRESCKVRR